MFWDADAHGCSRSNQKPGVTIQDLGFSIFCCGLRVLYLGFRAVGTFASRGSGLERGEHLRA